MHTTASPTANTNLTKMLSLFRKSKSSSASTVMANANTSETTLVSAPAKTGKGQRKPKYETEPYQAEFTGLSTLGGMPSLGGHFFVEPPKAKKTVVKMVPAQPFKASPRASFVEDRLSTVQGMFQPAVAPSNVVRGGKELSAKELVEQMYAPSAVGIGKVVAPMAGMKIEKVQ